MMKYRTESPAAAWFVVMHLHDGGQDIVSFKDYIEAETFTMLIPIMQVLDGGDWLDIARAIIKPANLTLN